MKNKNNTDKLREEIFKKFRYKFVTDSFMGLIMGKPRYIGNETHEVKDIEKFIKQALTQAHQAGYQEAVEEVRKQMAGELLKTQALADMSRGDGVKNVDMTAVEYSAIITRFTRFLTTLTKNEK